MIYQIINHGGLVLICIPTKASMGKKYELEVSNFKFRDDFDMHANTRQP